MAKLFGNLSNFTGCNNPVTEHTTMGTAENKKF